MSEETTTPETTAPETAATETTAPEVTTAPDPAALTEIRKLRSEAARHRVAARTERVNNAALLAAGDLGVSGAALLGSAAWRDAAPGLDPGAEDFQATLTETMTGLLKVAPWIAAPETPVTSAPPPPTSGGDFAGGNGTPGKITQAQLETMSAREIADALHKGELKHLM